MIGLIIVASIVLLLATSVGAATAKKVTEQSFTNADNGKTVVVKVGETFRVTITAPPDWLWWGMGGLYNTYTGEDYVTWLDGNPHTLLGDRTYETDVWKANSVGTFVITTHAHANIIYTLTVKIVPGGNDKVKDKDQDKP